MQVGKQLTEAIRNHRKMTKEEAHKEAIRCLSWCEFQIPNKEQAISS